PLARIQGMSCVPGEQAVDHRCKVAADLRVGREIGVLAGTQAIARQDQPGLATGFGAGMEVAQRVSDRRNASKWLIVATGDVMEHAGAGLATGAGIVRMVRAGKDGINPASCSGNFLSHLAVNAIEFLRAEQPPCHTRLVGGHHHAPSGPCQAANGFRAPGNRVPFFGRLDVGIAVMVDDAIAIQNDQLHEASREMSATWFIMVCKRASKVSRFCFRDSSSDMIMTWSKNPSTASRRPASVVRLAAKFPAASCSAASGASLSSRPASFCSAGSTSKSG